MFSWFTSLFPRKKSFGIDETAEVDGIPLPVTSVAKPSPRQNAGEMKLVSSGIPTSYGFVGSNVHSGHGPWHYPYPVPSPSRSGPSNVEWISSSDNEDDTGDDDSFPVVFPAPPAVVRVGSTSKLYPIGRSVSSPPSSSPHETSSLAASFSGTPSPKWNLRLNTNPAFSQSTHSLRLDTTPYTNASTGTDVYGHAYNYPLAKQLSPIVEQDYFSPTSYRGSGVLSGEHRHRESAPSIAYSISNTTNASPGGSQTSEITRPSPSFSSSLPFITRQLNWTISQTSSHTHVSTTSTIPRLSAKSTPVEPPVIPPLNLAPPFPGPHPSRDGVGPPLRHRRSMPVVMPTIAASTESATYMDEEYGGQEDLESLHAESFVTASDKMPFRKAHNDAVDMEAGDLFSHSDGRGLDTSITQAPSVHTSGSRHPSASESFISRRWNRDAALGSGVVVFRVKRQWMCGTPAFWAFWLGFVCPFLWLIGGWHFTHFGEQPPRLTFWEFYLNTTFLKEKLCCGRRQKEGDGVGKRQMGGESVSKDQPRLPRWVTEKQSSDDGRMRLQDPKRSLRGISFGYPFIPRPVTPCRSAVYPEACCQRVTKRVLHLLQKPNRLFDHLHGVKLREVRGRPESGRRIFDPWIQRCRYALCYALVFLCVGLCTTCTYLIIFSTRQPR